MSARSKARKRALDILYEADMRTVAVREALAERLELNDPPVSDYTVTLVEGVLSHGERIDEVLSDFAQGWTLDRMPGVDRAALRIAVFEMLWQDDVPDVVAIDEAVQLVKALSTEESPRFVNGLLGRVQRENPAGDEPVPDEPVTDHPAGDEPAGDEPAGDEPAGDVSVTAPHPG